jgi:hypothetical protein
MVFSMEIHVLKPSVGTKIKSDREKTTKLHLLQVKMLDHPMLTIKKKQNEENKCIESGVFRS